MKHPFYLILKGLATIFLLPSMSIEGAENLPEGPAVVVGNHSQAYGPVAAEIYFPGNHYTWCISEMMERDKVADYAYKDFWSKKPALVRPFFKRSKPSFRPEKLYLKLIHQKSIPEKNLLKRRNIKKEWKKCKNLIKRFKKKI